jgi:hypothetical protein
VQLPVFVKKFCTLLAVSCLGVCACVPMACKLLRQWYGCVYDCTSQSSAALAPPCSWSYHGIHVQMVEWAFQKLQMGDLAAAQEKFTAALNMDELSINANCGLVECQIHNDDLEEAASQLMFLQEMVATAANRTVAQDGVAHLQYLTALLAFKTKPAEVSAQCSAAQVPKANGGYHFTSDRRACDLPLFRSAHTKCCDLSVRVSHLGMHTIVTQLLHSHVQALAEAEKALELQLQCVAGLPLTMQLYSKLNPGRVLSLVHWMHQQAGGQPRSSTEGPSPVLSKCARCSPSCSLDY